MSNQLPHIAVCVCTFQRPDLLKRLLVELDKQESGGLFTFSAVVADNDAAGSARATIQGLKLSFPVKYCIEERRGIAFARNRVIENAEGDFLAFIDDDEFPVPTWLLTLFNVLHNLARTVRLDRCCDTLMWSHPRGCRRAAFMIDVSIRRGCRWSGRKPARATYF